MDSNWHKRFKLWRKTRNLTQEELAHKIGVCWATVNRWEAGKKSPSRMAIEQIRKAGGPVPGGRE